eukprot:15365511-Ditylum_brightwellii.AAC.1
MMMTHHPDKLYCIFEEGSAVEFIYKGDNNPCKIDVAPDQELIVCIIEYHDGEDMSDFRYYIEYECDNIHLISVAQTEQESLNQWDFKQQYHKQYHEERGCMCAVDKTSGVSN